MSDLEVRLVEIGGRLDHPDDAQLLVRVRAELGAAPASVTPRRRRRRMVQGVLAAAAAAMLLTAAVPSSRDAIANFFRVDGVELRSAHDRPRAPSSSTTLAPVDSIAAARRQIDFALRVPEVPTTPRVTVDREIPGGLVTLDYPDYRVVQFAAPPDGAVITKFVDPRTRVSPTDVRNQPGYWITGTHHDIAYLDRDENVRISTLHTAGHVLSWSEHGVTFRIEGPETLARAQQIAASLG